MEFRAACIQSVREFFVRENYLELDTPALAPELIPESCLEVFRTEYVSPVSRRDLFLVPSPEVYIKQVIAQHGRSVFQISKCYRNAESFARIHRPEFTMLEYYTMNADYLFSLEVTARLFKFVAEKISGLPLCEKKSCEMFSAPFKILSMNDAFKKYCGFALSEQTTESLALNAETLGAGEYEKLRELSWDDLYELILVHTIEPKLAECGIVALIDYPAKADCLAKERSDTSNPDFSVKERWEIYANGVELANCYTEERNENMIEKYFSAETKLKNSALVRHPSVKNFGEICSKMPECSGVALGVDRLIMLLAGKKTLDSFVYEF